MLRIFFGDILEPSWNLLLLRYVYVFSTPLVTWLKEISLIVDNHFEEFFKSCNAADLFEFGYDGNMGLDKRNVSDVIKMYVPYNSRIWWDVSKLHLHI